MVKYIGGENMVLIDVLIEMNALDQRFTYVHEYELELYTRVKVEFNHRECVGFVVGIKPYEELEFKVNPILEVIDEQSLLNEEMIQLAKWMTSFYCIPQISAYHQILPKKLKPKKTKVQPNLVAMVRIKQYEYKNEKQKVALDFIKNQSIERSAFRKEFKSIADRLIKDGKVEVYYQEKKAKLIQSEKKTEIHHTLQQKNAINQIEKLKSGEIGLLHGVTASGKSEVFYAIIEKILLKQKQVLLLVPEISLVSQMVKGLLSRFESNVALYHSGLNDQEKYEQYQAVKNNEVNLIVGTRSAVFLPFQNLGMIIIDEEHDQSYKQENQVLYDAIEIAKQRINYHKCSLLLASATPSVDSYARAIKNVYQLIEMPDKVNQVDRKIEVIDMHQQSRRSDYILSQQLLSSMKETLEKNEQVVLILNKRGYASYVKCLACGNVEQCENCDVALKYHSHDYKLKCHICDYEKEPTKYCSSCGSYELSHYGIGTQKLEEYVKKMFPQYQVARLDRDTTMKKNSLTNTLEAFENNEYQILIGTQMLSKGLDFANVTLVGMVNGDDLLSRESYKSVETMYQLLVQSFGRSGRKKAGKVVLQVYNTEHYAIQSAIKEDYKSFFKLEMNYRHLANYPPYVYLAYITLYHQDEVVVDEDAKYLESLLDLDYLGPTSIYKIHNQYRQRIVFKSKNNDELHLKLNRIYYKFKESRRKSKIEINFNQTTL